MLLFMHLSLISLLDTNVNCLSWVNLLKFCMTNQTESGILTVFTISGIGRNNWQPFHVSP